MKPKEKEFLDAGQCRKLLGFLPEMTNLQLPRAIELLTVNVKTIAFRNYLYQFGHAIWLAYRNLIQCTQA